jgi:PPK2 family polyphosphate:nucleotide phosphotransferase
MKNKLRTEDFRAEEDKKVRLKDWPTKVKDFYDSTEEYEERLQKNVGELSRLQNLLYANDRYSLLLIFQAMDAAGKDGAIAHVMSGVNPQGCQVFSFKHPSAEELDHDFLWRTTRCLPERGRIGIFNRSYYEEVLIVRVHPEILASQALPREVATDKDVWKRRYHSIRGFEEHLYRNGTRVLKFFLHVSKDEQRRRFLERIDDPNKNWKFSMSDMKERALWGDYQKAYEDAIEATSTDHAPWYIIPADDKKNTRLLVSQVIVEAMESLKLSYPKTTKEHRKELLAIRKILAG